MNPRRTIMRKLRLTEEENTAIEELALQSRKTFSAFLRECALDANSYRFPREMWDLLEDLTKQIKKIGVNINQVVHYCNEKKGITVIEFEQLRDLLISIERKIDIVIDELRGRTY